MKDGLDPIFKVASKLDILSYNFTQPINVNL